MNRAFTLIELLIVVAIIAILAAIAVPNFLEAQARAKVSRTKTDMRACATAVEAYAVDHSKYPPPIGYEAPAPFEVADPVDEAFEGFLPYRLTTPVAYITSLPIDVFEVGFEEEHPKRVSFHYSEQVINEQLGSPMLLPMLATLVGFGNGAYRYVMFSHGPDLKHQDGSDENGPPAHYDATNGTISAGDVYYFGPGRGFNR
jgi:prepilin-type N-terminal cleavage/methylation domain-containing protein